jgi:hypothetical protein
VHCATSAAAASALASRMRSCRRGRGDMSNRDVTCHVHPLEAACATRSALEESLVALSFHGLTEIQCDT